MPIEFLCNECGTKLRVADASAGKQAKCPKCATVLDIPGEPAPENPDEYSVRREPEMRQPATTGGVSVAPPVGGSANPYQAPGSYTAPQRNTFNNAPVSHGTIDPGQAFSVGWELYTNKFGPGLGAVAITTIVAVVLMMVGIFGAIILAAAIGGAANDEAMAGIGFLVGMLVLFLPAMIAYLLLYYNMVVFFLKLCRGQEPSFGELFKYDSNFWPTLVASICMTILVYIGMIFCIVPGIYLGCMFYAWPLLVLERRMPIGEAFNLSKELSEGNKMNIFVLWLIVFAISMVAGFIPLGGLFAMPLTTFIFLIGYLMMTGQYGPPRSQPHTESATGTGNPFAT